jgi:hypothetical protein
LRIRITLLRIRIPAFHCKADTDPAFHFHTDLDSVPAPQKSDSNMRPLVPVYSRAQFFDPLKLLNFDFNADPHPHPASHFNEDPDPDPQTWSPIKDPDQQDLNFLASSLNDSSVLSWNSAKFNSSHKGKVSQDSDLSVSDLGAELHEAGGRLRHTARQLASRLVPTQ